MRLNQQSVLITITRNIAYYRNYRNKNTNSNIRSFDWKHVVYNFSCIRGKTTAVVQRAYRLVKYPTSMLLASHFGCKTAVEPAKL